MRILDNKKDIKVHDSETSSLLEKMKNQEIDNKPKIETSEDIDNKIKEETTLGFLKMGITMTMSLKIMITI